MKIKKGFVIEEVAGSYLACATGKLAKSFNGFIRLNESGAFLWKMLSEGDKTEEDLANLLAKEYGTTTGNILQLNPMITDVRNIQIGSILTIPIPPKNSFIYVVRPGDTVYRIAQNNGLTVEDIMKYNYIESDYTLYPGQQLVIIKK